MSERDGKKKRVLSPEELEIAKAQRRVWWATVPSPPPLNAIFADADAVAGALGLTRRRFRDVRKEPTFPEGRLLAGGATLRWRLRDVLAWADAQRAAKYSTVGGRRPGAFGRGEHAA